MSQRLFGDRGRAAPVAGPAARRRRPRAARGDAAALQRQPLQLRSLAAILGFEGGLALLAAGLALGHRSERLAARRGVLLAVLAGPLFALAGIAIKGLTGGAGVSLADHRLAGSLIIVALRRSSPSTRRSSALQRGGAIETIGLMGLVANATQIVGGVLVFGDPLSPGPLGIVLQAAAFAMVCVSALLIPAAGRAAPPAFKPIAS